MGNTRSSLVDKIGNVLDMAVAIVNPRRGLERHLRREQWKKRSTLYAAAETTKSTGGWAPTNANVNLIIAASAPNVRARIRQLVRDFPYFARAVKVLTDYSVGERIEFQSRILGPDGDFDDKRIQLVEDTFKFWKDEADFSGKLSYDEMMVLSKRQDLEAGEFFLVQRMDRDPSRFLPYCLQMIEADWLSDYGAKPIGDPRIIELDQGVEFNKETGKTIAYHFTDPDSYAGTIRVEARHVIHGFEFLRPGQRRGISPFAPGVLVADDLANLLDSEIDASKMASKWLALVTTADPLSRQVGSGVTTGVNGEKIEELENAIIEYLRPGEKVEIQGNPRPGTNFSPFVRLILCMFSITTGAPYELVSGDYKGMNYSTGKLVRNDFRQALKPISGRVIRHFANPTFRGFFNSAVLKNKFDFPNYFFNPAPWLKCEWQPPGMESQDPLRESKANIDDVAAGLRSPQEIIRARGRDPEAVVRELSEFKKLLKKYNVELQTVSTALANNPAAVEKQDKRQTSEQLFTLEEIIQTLENITEGLSK